MNDIGNATVRADTATDSRNRRTHHRTRAFRRALLPPLVAVLALAASVGSAGAQSAPRTEEFIVEGIFGAVHADPGDGRSKPYLETFVTSERDSSQTTPISLPHAVANRYGGIDALTSKRVAVHAVSPTRGRDRATLTAVDIDVRGDATKWLPLGSGGEPATPAPALTVLCRFADKPAQPQMQPFFHGLAGENSVMDDYFRTTSYHQVNLFGSRVAPATGDWYVLPGNEADYLEDKKVILSKSFSDCSKLAAADFDLNKFAVINIAMNTDLAGTWAFGGRMDGRNATWLTPWGWSQATVTAHEMGHAFTMTHVGLAGSYDNAWDVLSGWDLACSPIPTYACMPQHQSAYNKMKAGWLDGRMVDVPAHATTTVELAPVDSPGTGKVLARIAPPDPVANHKYYVEFRRPVGLDANLPLAGAPGAVIIYEYWEFPAPTEKEPDKIGSKTQLMGFDGKAGARWLPGMVFDREKMFTGNSCYWDGEKEVCKKSAVEEAWDYEIDGIRIRVDSITPDKATVTFTQLPRTSLQAGSTTPSSYEVHWVDNANTETFFKISYTDNKKNSAEVNVPANSTSYTFHNAPSGVTLTNFVQACNSIACGPVSNFVSSGADPKPLKTK
jgi:hypothetical protein